MNKRPKLRRQSGELNVCKVGPNGRCARDGSFLALPRFTQGISEDPGILAGLRTVAMHDHQHGGDVGRTSVENSGQVHVRACG